MVVLLGGHVGVSRCVKRAIPWQNMHPKSLECKLYSPAHLSDSLTYYQESSPQNYPLHLRLGRVLGEFIHKTYRGGSLENFTGDKLKNQINERAVQGWAFRMHV